MLSQNVLSQVYGLYDDEQGAFIVPLKLVSQNNRHVQRPHLYYAVI